MVLRRARSSRGAPVASAAILAAFVLSCSSPRVPAIPSLTLIDTAGTTTSLPGDLAHAKLTVIVFYADHCPCFRVHEKRLRDLARTYGPQGVRVLIVDSEVSASAERDAHATAERGLPAIALDPGGKLADAVGAEYATYTAVLDTKGRVRYRGGIDADKNVLHEETTPFLRDALDDLLAGREPRLTEGKVLGCALQKR